jgi:PAS domain S-box-containing protein
MYQLKHLPGYAQFVLDNHLEDFINEQIDLSFKMNVPLLKFLSHFSRQQLFEQSKIGSTELLQHIAENRSKEHLQTNMEKWLANQLDIVGKYDIVAEDITLINYVRQEALKKILPGYTTDIQKALDIISELNLFVLAQNTTAVNTYIKLLQEKIEEESNFSNNIIQASPSITYIFDLVKQQELYVSGKVKEVMGHEPEEIISLGNEMISKLAHPDDFGTIAEMMEAISADTTNQTHIYEYRFKDRWENYRWLRTYCVVFKRNEKGKPVQILGQTFDVSKEKELVIAIKKREKELLEAQSIAKVGSFDWDLETRQTEYTPELLRILEVEHTPGYENFMNHVHPDDRHMVEESMARGMKEGFYECEYRYIANNKQKILWAKGGVLFKDGKPHKMIGTLQDITERKQIEETLLEKTIELERSNAGLQEFASVASHDLKEPLRKIATFSDLLISAEKARLSEQGNYNLQKIIDASTRMRNLIDDILAFSSLSGKEEKQHRSLKEMVQEVLNILEIPIKEKGAQIHVSDLPFLKIYPLQMQQLFLNLISNSLKFSKKDVAPVINITHSIRPASAIHQKTIMPASKYLEIKVADNGIGFSSEAKEKVFQLFHRLHTRSQYEGTGVGLAICRKVAENHGGIILADSKPDDGAVFTILLPFE